MWIRRGLAWIKRLLVGCYADDWVDRQHYQLTSYVLLALALLVAGWQFFGRPLECLLPIQFPSSYQQVNSEFHNKCNYILFTFLLTVFPHNYALFAFSPPRFKPLSLLSLHPQGSDEIEKAPLVFTALSNLRFSD